MKEEDLMTYKESCTTEKQCRKCGTVMKKIPTAPGHIQVWLHGADVFNATNPGEHNARECGVDI
jgi:hypothetical protein